MEASDNIKAKIRKILELARTGVDGERTTAMKMFETMCQKYGLKMSDFDESVPARRKIYYQGKFERDLAFSILRKVVDDSTIEYYKRHRAKTYFYIDLANLQWYEFEMLYELYREHMKKEFDITFTAFIHKNNLFASNTPVRDDTDLTPEELAELERIMNAMCNMDVVEVRKQLTASPR